MNRLIVGHTHIFVTFMRYELVLLYDIGRPDQAHILLIDNER